MKTLRGLIAGIVIAVAFTAFAISRTFTGTIDTPAVWVWVTPTGGVVVPAVGGLATLPSTPYLDPTTGYYWNIGSLSVSQPQLYGVDVLRQFYATANCTGTIYTGLPSYDDHAATRVAVILEDGQTYVTTGIPVTQTFQSEWNGSACVSPYGNSFTVYAVSGPVAPPTLPAGPYHLELR